MELSIGIPKLARLIAAETRVVPAWLSPAEAAIYTGLPEKTFEQYRREATGPPFSRVGKHVRLCHHARGMEAFYLTAPTRWG